MKRMVSVCLAFYLLFSLGYIGVAAEAEVALSIKGGNLLIKENNLGETIVAVNLDKNPGIQALSVRLEYDPESLRLLSYQNGSIWTNCANFFTKNDKDLQVDYFYMTDTEFKGTGELFTVKFQTTNEALETVTYPLNLVVDTCQNKKGVNIINKVTNASIMPPVKVTGVSLNRTNLELKIGGKETLTAIIAPADAGNQAVIWSSSNPDVAYVDEQGRVTALSAGEATITVTTVEGGFQAACQVTVTDPVIKVTGVSLNEAGFNLQIGSVAIFLRASVIPYEATNKAVIWSSSNPDIAYVDEQGRVTALSAGEATITVTTVDGGFTDTCEVMVPEPIIRVTGVSLNESNLSLEVGSKAKLIAKIVPTKATKQEVIWTSSNLEVAEVDNQGKITAVAAGKAVITVTTVEGGFQAACQVTVTDPVIKVTGVSLNEAGFNLQIGSVAIFLRASVIPYEATNKAVIWSSSNPDVAYVDEQGRVTALSAGEATITVTTVDGGFTDTCEVMVPEPIIRVTGVSLNESNLSLEVGSKAELIAKIVPTKATKQEVIWTSSNLEVAEVDNQGKITAVAAGKAVITVTTVEGGFQAACQVTVTDSVTKLAGDINGDGKVNNRDATRILQHLAGWKVEVVEECLDVNGDGKFNNRDATRLLQYLAGWPVEIF